MYAEAGFQLPAFSQGLLQEVAGGSYQGHCSQLPLPSDDSLFRFHVGLPDGGFNSVSFVICSCSLWREKWVTTSRKLRYKYFQVLPTSISYPLRLIPILERRKLLLYFILVLSKDY